MFKASSSASLQSARCEEQKVVASYSRSPQLNQMDPKQRKLAFEFNAPWLPYNITLSYFISFGKLMYRLAEAIYFSLYFLGQPSIMIFMIYEVFPFSVCVRSYIHNISNLKILSSSLQFLTGSTFCCYSFSLMYCKARTLAGGLIFFWEKISNIYSNILMSKWTNEPNSNIWKLLIHCIPYLPT